MKQAYLMTEWTDPETGAKGYLVVDEIRQGLCAGGIRMREGVTQEEVKRLAEIMTVKMASLGQAIGGAKGGIDFPADHPESKAVLKRYLAAHLPYIKDFWLTSEDLGTREEDIVILLQELGLQSPVQAFMQKEENSLMYLQELQKAMGARYDALPLMEVVTGYGIAVVTMQGLQHLNLGKDVKVALQGFGSVGASSAKFLHENGVKLVAIADVNGTIYCEEGLDVPLLFEKKDARGNITRDNLPAHYEHLPTDAWLNLGADVLIPAAIPDAINKNNVADIDAKLIVEGANIPVSHDAEQELFDRDILVIPDFIANSGGVGLFVSILGGSVKGETAEIMQFLEEKMSKATEEMLHISKKENILPRVAAEQYADALVK